MVSRGWGRHPASSGRSMMMMRTRVSRRRDSPRPRRSSMRRRIVRLPGLVISAPLPLLPRDKVRRRGRRHSPHTLGVVSVVRVPVIEIIIRVRIVSVGGGGGPHVVIILLIQLHLGQRLAGLLLLVLHVHLPPLVAAPPHLLGLSLVSLDFILRSDWSLMGLILSSDWLLPVSFSAPRLSRAPTLQGTPTPAPWSLPPPQCSSCSNRLVSLKWSGWRRTWSSYPGSRVIISIVCGHTTLSLSRTPGWRNLKLVLVFLQINNE